MDGKVIERDNEPLSSSSRRDAPISGKIANKKEDSPETGKKADRGVDAD